MDLDAMWEKALKRTEVIRPRIAGLSTFETTPVPYVFLAESGLNEGDTVVRRGQVMIERASLVLPTARFEGFEFERNLQLGEDSILNFLLIRGVRFPSLRYRHELSSLDLREGPLAEAIRYFQSQLAQREDTASGLVVGPEDTWQLSILILVASLLVRSADGDVRRLVEEWRKRQRPPSE